IGNIDGNAKHRGRLIAKYVKRNLGGLNKTQVTVSVGIGFLWNELGFSLHYDFPVILQHVLKFAFVGVEVGMIFSGENAYTRVVGLSGRFVYQEIFSIPVLREDRKWHQVNDLPESCFALAQRLFGLLLLPLA